MTAILDKLLEFFSSLKLAIFLILSLAFYLGSATCYEARYGTRAVQELIYASRPFILLMALLAINVMGAVLVRYPWKRKQTGFIITHIGIEILLLGCLISFRFSVDGRMSLRPGDKSEVINLDDEEVGVTMADAGGTQRRRSEPVNLWKDAGYPGLTRFVLGTFGLMNLPPEARWQDGHTVNWPLGGGAKLEVLDWLPAAIGEQIVKATPDGFPAAVVHLGGHLPSGMPMDQDIPLLADGQGNGMVRPMGLEMDLWKARSDWEFHEFMNPPAPADLPEMGRVAVYLNGKRYTVDVTKDTLGKDQAVGDSGYKALVEDYILTPPAPQLPEGHGAAAMATEPVDPQIKIDLTGPKGTRKYLLAAWHPQFMAEPDDSGSGHHAAADGTGGPDDQGGPVMWYWHPQTYVTTKEGTRGRLWLILAPDNKLYGRMFHLADQQSKPPFEVQVGKEVDDHWVSISVNVTQFCPAGAIVNDFRAAHVTPAQMDQHSRAIKVALDVDGNRQETWLEREGGPVQLNTARGPVQLEYGFREFDLGFTVGLNHAEQTNDPGSNQAAAYTSEVTIQGTDKSDGSHIITMNEPLTVSGLTMYQAGMTQDSTMTFSTLSVRHDPGWFIKYLGCALIVGGIFTMFYMKAYFQPKAPVPVPTPGKPQAKGAAAMAKSV